MNKTVIQQKKILLLGLLNWIYSYLTVTMFSISMAKSLLILVFSTSDINRYFLAKKHQLT